VTATPLEDIHLPIRAIAQLADVQVTDWIDNHKIDVGRDWWTSTLHKYGFDDTLVGETIRRADIFTLADQAAEAPGAALIPLVVLTPVVICIALLPSVPKLAVCECTLFIIRAFAADQITNRTPWSCSCRSCAPCRSEVQG
jgi:hypothetical protein